MFVGRDPRRAARPAGAGSPNRGSATKMKTSPGDRAIAVLPLFLDPRTGLLAREASMKQIAILALFLGGLVVAGLVAFGGTPDRPPSEMAGPAMTRLSRAWDLFGSREYEFSQLRLYKRVAQKVSEDYVDPERVDASKMLTAALERVARTVPEALFDYDEAAGTVHAVIGGAETTVATGPMRSVGDLTRVLGQLSGFIEEHLQGDRHVELPKVEYALINGMLGTLDPHSVFIEPDDFKEMQVQNKGKFGGLGITIGIRDRRLTILYPLQGTPAWRAGLRAMDRIVRIEEESTINMALDEAVDRLRGDVGTPIRITIEREGDPPQQVTLVREEIKVPSVKHAYLGQGIGYLKLIHFAEMTADDMDLALAEMGAKATAEGKGALEGLVLDLRDNPGGYLQQAVLVADRFIDQGVIVTTVGHGNLKIDEEEAHKFGTDDRMRIVVLVDHGSASASEIVSGALKNHDRAVVVGVRTFGKGSVQNLYEMEDATALKLTIAKYLTPGNRSIQSVGVTPDIALRPALVDRNDVRMFWQDRMTREADLDEHFDKDPDALQKEEPEISFVYHDAALFKDDSRRDREETADDFKKDFQVVFARTIIEASGSSDRRAMLREARAAIEKLMAPEEQKLVEAFRAVGVDWSTTQGKGTPRAEVALVGGPAADGTLRVGERNPLILKVKNVGTGPFLRLRAVTESDLLGAREFVLGRIEPGEERAASIELTPGLHMSARTDEVKVHFFTEGSAAPEDHVGRVRIAERARPRFAYSYQVIDDGSGESRGNGDGLVQPGEAIDLLVAVRNIGEGRTGDDWFALAAAKRDDALAAPPVGSEADAEAAHAAGDDADKDRKAGFVQVRNKAGNAAFLTRGTAEFSLEPGQVVRERLHFDVRADASAPLEFQVTVGDVTFFETFVDEVTLPVQASGASVEPVEKVVRAAARTAVRGGASADGPVVAWMRPGIVAVDGKLGDHFRVALPWGAPGWVRAADVAPAKGPASLQVEEAFVRSPPVIALSTRAADGVSDQATLTLRGTASDDVALRDLYVFVNGRKVFYRSLAGRAVSQDTGDRYEFEIPVGLEPGENDIEVYARDRSSLVGATSLGIYRPGGSSQAAAR